MSWGEEKMLRPKNVLEWEDQQCQPVIALKYNKAKNLLGTLFFIKMNVKVIINGISEQVP